MPAILRPEDYARWLSPDETEPAELLGLLGPYSETEMEACPVSTQVNRPANDSPACIERAEPQTLF
jgi:putative SOS response-associated peptidase YedK